MKPKIFIGSSVEGIQIAKAVQTELEFEAEVTIWNQGIFNLSGNTLADLLSTTKNIDFAIMVFTPDDEVNMRSQTSRTIRDNVLFELGLFMGALGQTNVFYLMPRGIEMHIPTDLLGITPGTYDPNRTDANLVAAVGPFCQRVTEQINRIGPLKTFTELSQLMESINPFINANIKNGTLQIPINLSSISQSKLHELKSKPNFDDLVSFVSNGNIVANSSNRTGNSLNDSIGGMQNGFNFTFTDKYATKLK